MVSAFHNYAIHIYGILRRSETILIYEGLLV